MLDFNEIKEDLIEEIMKLSTNLSNLEEFIEGFKQYK